MRRLNRDEVMQVWRLVGCEDFLGEREEFVLDNPGADGIGIRLLVRAD